MCRAPCLGFLLRAGVEPNPGPTHYICPICMTKLRQYSVKCTCCTSWLHIKWSGLRTAIERKKYPNWIGPCCTRQLPPASIPQNPPTPPPPPTQRAHKAPRRQQDRPNRRRPSPPPARPSREETAFNIVQFNINGIAGKIEELLDYLEKNNIQIAVLQETKLHDR